MVKCVKKIGVYSVVFGIISQFNLGFSKDSNNSIELKTIDNKVVEINLDEFEKAIVIVLKKRISEKERKDLYVNEDGTVTIMEPKFLFNGDYRRITGLPAGACWKYGYYGATTWKMTDAINDVPGPVIFLQGNGQIVGINDKPGERYNVIEYVVCRDKRRETSE